MSKQPAAQEAGGERRSRARSANSTPSRTAAAAAAVATAVAAQPPTRHLSASLQRGPQAVPGALHDGAGTSAMYGRPRRHREFVSWKGERGADLGEGRGPGGPEQSPGEDGAETIVLQKRRKPLYVPPALIRWEQPHASSSRPPAAEEPPTMPGPVYAPPRGPRGRHGGGLTTIKTVEHVSTFKDDDGVGHQAAPPATGAIPPPHNGPTHTPHGGQRYSPRTRTRSSSSSPIDYSESKKKRRPVMAFCFTACCILFWLLVIAIGVAVLVVYLLYRPEPPRLRLAEATLNAGYIDELGRRRWALNSDVTALANISSPNTKIDMVLRYTQLDLFFEGKLIGTQAVWPPPGLMRPGDSRILEVHIVVSEVALSLQDAGVWRNATDKGGPVVLQLAGRFHTQLNFGRWLPYRYWVHPRCTLWFDPPPVGTLRRVRC